MVGIVSRCSGVLGRQMRGIPTQEVGILYIITYYKCMLFSALRICNSSIQGGNFQHKYESRGSNAFFIVDKF
jgi:hypothetical protein